MPLPATTERVAQHTAPHVNARIQRMTEMSIAYYRQNPEEIPERLRALEKEWDIERALETNASSLMLAGMSMGLLFSRKFFVLPFAVSGFLLQHGLKGWCPPLPLLRRLGYRTQTEIEKERHALLSIQGGSNTTQ